MEPAKRARVVLRLRTSDGKALEVDREVLRKAKTIDDMVQDLGMSDESTTVAPDEIPLQDIRMAVLEQVLAWCTQHKDDAEPLAVAAAADATPPVAKPASEWDAEFVKGLDTALLFETILAANYLNIDGLLDLTCKQVADMMKGKQPQQIRDMFGLENDFPPDEYERLCKENAWALDD